MKDHASSCPALGVYVRDSRCTCAISKQGDAEALAFLQRGKALAAKLPKETHVSQHSENDGFDKQSWPALCGQKSNILAHQIIISFDADHRTMKLEPGWSWCESCLEKQKGAAPRFAHVLSSVVSGSVFCGQPVRNGQEQIAIELGSDHGQVNLPAGWSWCNVCLEKQAVERLCLAAEIGAAHEAGKAGKMTTAGEQIPANFSVLMGATRPETGNFYSAKIPNPVQPEQPPPLTPRVQALVEMDEIGYAGAGGTGHVEQPLPTAGEQSVFDALAAHIEKRKAIGIERYGRVLETFNGRSMERDALEEALDLTVYLMGAELERAKLESQLEEARARNRAHNENTLLLEKVFDDLEQNSADSAEMFEALRGFIQDHDAPGGPCFCGTSMGPEGHAGACEKARAIFDKGQRLAKKKHNERRALRLHLAEAATMATLLHAELKKAKELLGEAAPVSLCSLLRNINNMLPKPDWTDTGP